MAPQVWMHWCEDKCGGPHAHRLLQATNGKIAGSTQTRRTPIGEQSALLVVPL